MVLKLILALMIMVNSIFFEFINKDDEKESLGCGAYNLNFLDDIIFTIDRKGYYENKYDYDKIYEQLSL